MLEFISIILLGYVCVFRPVRGFCWNRNLRFSARWSSVGEAASLCGAGGVFVIWLGVGRSCIGMSVSVLNSVCATLVSIGVVSGLDLFFLAMFLRAAKRNRMLLGRNVPSLVKHTLDLSRSVPQFVCLCICSGIWEELLFRAIPMCLATNGRISMACAVAVSTAVFSLNHSRAGIHGMIHSAFFGLLFFGLLLVHKSLVANVLAHVVGNIVAGMIVAPRIKASSEQPLFPL